MSLILTYVHYLLLNPPWTFPSIALVLEIIYYSHITEVVHQALFWKAKMKQKEKGKDKDNNKRKDDNKD